MAAETGVNPKKFVYKQTFTGFPIEFGRSYCGKQENYFNVPWRCYIYQQDRFLFTQLQCRKYENAPDWSVEAEIVLKGIKTYEAEIVTKKTVTFSNSNTDIEFWRALIHPNVQYFLIDGSFTVEFHVEIKKMTGFKENLRSFNDVEAKEYSDVVLAVGDQKFHVNRKYLALHSSYFKKLFLEDPIGSEQSEILVTDLNPHDFQNFLELIHGESAVDDDTVNGILPLAEILNSKTAMARCEEFLLEKSGKLLKDKFELAVDFELEKLKEKCFSEMKTFEDIRSVVRKTSNLVEDSVWKGLLMKALSLT